MQKYYTILLKVFNTLLAIVIFFAIHQALLMTFTKPNNDRNWTIDQQKLATINFTPSTVTIENIKNFSYPSPDEKQKQPGYQNDTFEYNKVKDVWYFQNDFAEPLGAHSFLTFEFEDNKYLSFSAEVRKEVGESYSPWKGLFNHYELEYMLVSEKDILTLRAGLRDPDVYMYRLNLNKNEKVNLFKNVLLRAEKVNNNPEFYNTYNNACTTNIFYHLNEILDDDRKPGNSWKVIFPKYSDEFLYDKNLIDTGLGFKEIKQSSKINQKVREALRNNLNDLEFSQFIRSNRQQFS
jgi:hypothetical protein